jgi:hypothetical protein
MRWLIALFSLITASGAFAGGPASCLSYGPSVVTVTGRVVIRTFFGPPNWGEDPAHDSIETQAQLRLDKPICVTHGPNDDLGDGDVSEINQRVITLVPLTEKPAFSSLSGKHIRVTGQLYHAHTMHHRTPLLISVYNVSDVVVLPAK